MKPLFHRLTDEQFEKHLQEGATYADFRQPRWCGYPDALEWHGGCWSLTERKIRRQADCRDCDCIKKPPHPAGAG